MVIRTIKTRRVHPGTITIFQFLDGVIDSLKEASIVVVTSKVVSICEGRLIDAGRQTKEELIKQESQYYLPADFSHVTHQFTISHNSLVGAAGIDFSKFRNQYILWPLDPQKTANQIRRHLADRFGLTELGVIISDSVSTPFRRGAVGIAIAHSGFEAIKKYRKARANLAGGLAAAAAAEMGEGAELRPLAIIEDIPFINFQARNPSKGELEDYYLSRDEDLFKPFWDKAGWRKGSKA